MSLFRKIFFALTGTPVATLQLRRVRPAEQTSHSEVRVPERMMPKTMPEPETLIEEVRRVLATGEPPERECDLVNSVVDLIVQANINLHSVTLDDMKDLLADALESRRRMLAYLP